MTAPDRRDASATPQTAAATASVRPARFAALRSRDFTVLWLGFIVSTAGSQMQLVARAWIIVQRTDSPLALAVLNLMYTVPITLVPLIAGVIADRVNRVTLLKVTLAIQFVQPLVVAALLATDHAPLWVLYVDTALVATMNAFVSPAQQALMPALVPREHLLNATALQSAVWTSASLIGPALGGLLLAPLGAAWIFAINGLTTLVVLVGLFTLRDVPRFVPPVKTRTRGDGFGAIRRIPFVPTLLVFTAGFALIGNGYAVLLPFFARDIWGAGAQGYGLALTAPAVGSLLATFGLAAFGDVRHKAMVASACAAAYCAALLVFAHTSAYPLGLALLVLAGVSGAIPTTILLTLLQLATPDAVRGRVMSLRFFATAGVGNMGGFAASAFAQAAGAAVVVTYGAVAFLAITPLLAWQLTRVQRGETTPRADGP